MTEKRLPAGSVAAAAAAVLGSMKLPKMRRANRYPKPLQGARERERRRKQSERQQRAMTMEGSA